MITGIWWADLFVAILALWCLWRWETRGTRYTQIEHIRYYENGAWEVDLIHPKMQAAMKEACEKIEKLKI